jgi:acyl-CoA reductase-like NAD-dependent aldehyde dehydrogenase
MHAVLDPRRKRISAACAKARDAQTRWALEPIGHRLRIIREFRHRLAAKAEALARAAAAVNDRSIAEKLASEVLPLADACLWLEQSATRVLAPRRYGRRKRPLWMNGVSFEVQRQPFGLVLVIGPGNYPLFLPAVHSLQALAAGNAILLKPAPGTREVALAFARLAQEAGLDSGLLTILSERVQAAYDAITDGVDKVIFTGASENGREVLKNLSDTNTPAVMELSGEDTVIVFADADLDLVVRALKFGTRLNGGNTCIAPRRLIVEQPVADDLRTRLERAHIPPLHCNTFCDGQDALDQIHSSDFALGASIFSRQIRRAQAFGTRIKTGFVLINDLVVPTADPRMPFGGRKTSGFGSTRGEEGLLEMTFPHVVALRRGNSHRHFDEAGPDEARLFSSYIRAAHGRGCERVGATRDLVGALFAKIRNRRTKP